MLWNNIDSSDENAKWQAKPEIHKLYNRIESCMTVRLYKKEKYGQIAVFGNKNVYRHTLLDWLIHSTSTHILFPFQYARIFVCGACKCQNGVDFTAKQKKCGWRCTFNKTYFTWRWLHFDDFLTVTHATHKLILYFWSERIVFILFSFCCGRHTHKHLSLAQKNTQSKHTRFSFFFCTFHNRYSRMFVLLDYHKTLIRYIRSWSRKHSIIFAE